MSKQCISCGTSVDTSCNFPTDHEDFVGEDWKNSKKFDGVLCEWCDEPEHTFDCIEYRNENDTMQCNCI